MTPDDLAALHAIEQRLTAASAAVEQRLTERQDRAVETILTEIRAAEDRAQEFARAIETNLLTAFHGHAKGQAARLHTTEVTATDLSTRIAALEERILNLETRRPPQ
jgi:phage terminase small subunit